MARLVLGVAGGIAAYKACTLLRLLTESGHEVTVVPTEAALEFVGAATWAALSGGPVATRVFDRPEDVNHVRLGREADLVVVAPATADLLARAAQGRADDLLTNVLLTTTAPVLMAPAMHTEMWAHPATKANVETLRERGVLVVEPATGRLTGSDSGPGRLPEGDDIFHHVQGILGRRVTRDLAGRRVVVSAGGTREHLDPVRFLGNASSGRMGVAVARAARLRGAEVTLVASGLEVNAPAAVDVVPARSTADLQRVMSALAPGADVVVMAAAVADYRPRETSATKLSKAGDAGLTLTLDQNPDVLAGLGRAKPAGQVLVGFAAETAADEAALLERGRRKLTAKGCDLLVVNDVGGGAVFGSPDNAVLVLARDGGEVGRFAANKSQIAHDILDAVVARLDPKDVTP